MGPGMDPLSFLVISSSIDRVQSVSIHSSARNSALWDANANNAVHGKYDINPLSNVSTYIIFWRIIYMVQSLDSAD